MEEKKNNKGLVCLIVILIILVLGLVGYIIYDKVLLKDKATIENNSTTTTTERVSTTTRADEETFKIDNKNIERKTLEECNFKDCNIYKSNNLSIVLKNITKKDYDIYGDVYINNVFSKTINFEDTSYNVNNNIEIEIFNDKYILFRFANEAAMYVNFYLFKYNGLLISDFEDEKELYEYDWLTINVKNDELFIEHLMFIPSEMPLKYEYCEADVLPSDNYRITKKVTVENDKIRVLETNNITWEDAYKCGSTENGGSEDCGDIKTVVCN